MANLSYTTAQVDGALRKVIAPNKISLGVNSESPSTIVIASGNVDTFVPFPVALVAEHTTGFTLVGTTLTYTGANAIFKFDASTTVGVSAVNTTIHFILAINGTTKVNTTSANKIESTTDLDVFVANQLVQLNTNDVVAVYIKADKACTISAYHTQITFAEL